MKRNGCCKVLRTYTSRHFVGSSKEPEFQVHRRGVGSIMVEDMAEAVNGWVRASVKMKKLHMSDAPSKRRMAPPKS